MEKLTTVYLAREYMLTDDFGGIRIDEEAIFSAFELARNFLKTLEDKETTGIDLILFRTEIVEYQIEDTDSYERKWIYNLRGELIEESALSNNISKTDKHECTYCYQVGDVVYLLPKIKNLFSPSIKGTYGVIAEIPPEQCKEQELEYVIYYIAENGFLDHFHAAENCLVAHEGALPNELRCLDLYSNYIKKGNKLSEDMVSKIVNKEVFIKNIKTFNFTRENIVDSKTPESGVRKQTGQKRG